MKNTSPRLLSALRVVYVLIVICLPIINILLSSTNADLVADNMKLSSDLVSFQKSNSEISIANEALNSMIDKLAQQISNQEQTISNLEAQNASQAADISKMNQQFVTIQDSMPVQVTLMLEDENGNTYPVSWWAFATPVMDMEYLLPTNRMSIVDPIVSIELYFPAADEISHVNAKEIQYSLDDTNRIQVQLTPDELQTYYFASCFQICFEGWENELSAPLYLSVEVHAGAL